MAKIDKNAIAKLKALFQDNEKALGSNFSQLIDFFNDNKVTDNGDGTFSVGNTIINVNDIVQEPEVQSIIKSQLIYSPDLVNKEQLATKADTSAIDPSVMVKRTLTADDDVLALDPGTYYTWGVKPKNFPALSLWSTVVVKAVGNQPTDGKSVTITDVSASQQVNTYSGGSSGGRWSGWQVPNSNTMASKSDVTTAISAATANMADDSKVAHLSGANNFDTVPTVDNNPLLLASSLPSDPAFVELQTQVDNQKNDLNNNINSKLAQISSVPETFANLAALQAKYPNGANGLMVAADNGHKYIWANNVWTDAGVYQSVGIADGAVTEEKTDFLKSVHQYIDENERQQDSYYYFAGPIGSTVGITSGASGFYAYDKIFIKKGMTVSILNCKLTFSGVVDLNNKKIIRFSDNDTVGDYEYTAIQDCYILVTATSLIPKIINIELRNVTESMRNSEKGTLSVEISGISISEDNQKKIADGSISPSKTNFIKIINQALDKSSAVENACWYFSGAVGKPVGQTTNATGMWAYNKVHVNKGETWSILQARLVFSGFTDAQGNKLSQFSTTDITGDIEYTADQDGYICVTAQGTMPKAINLPLADITDDMRTSPAGVIGTRITGIYLSADNHKKITVSTAPALLKAINDLSNDTDYSDATIYLQEGVYDLYTAMGGASYIASVDAAASGEMFGLNLPDRVSLVGNPHATITFEIPDDVATNTSSSRISVISILHTHTLENLDIIGKNVRYAVHDETGNGVSGLTRVVKNCHIEHLGNASGLWSSTQAYAIGTGSGGSYDFENTVFKSVNSVWSAHDNANQKDNTFKFNHCKFVTGSDYSIRFGTYGSGDDMNHVTINNCDIDKYIYVMEEIPDSKTGMRFELKGSGNTKVPYWSVNSAGARLPIEFCDETARITNIGTDTIKDGTPIKLTDIGKGIAMGPTDGAYMAYGIALEDIAPGEQGVVKYAGYLSRDDTPLSSLTVGSRIGIIDGKLAQTNDDHYIGVVTQWRNILLRF